MLTYIKQIFSSSFTYLDAVKMATCEVNSYQMTTYFHLPEGDISSIFTAKYLEFLYLEF